MVLNPRHTLTEKDPESRAAFCSICGPVEIRPNGRGWICLTKKREAAASWRRANPERHRNSGQVTSDHKLTEVDRESRRGTCPVDGEVPITAIGRGWMCGVRAAQLGRTVNLSTEPTARCKICNHWASAELPVDASGTCSSCLGVVTAFHPKTAMALPNKDRGLMDGYDGGWLMIDPENYDELLDDGWNYDDPSLKTLGPPLAADDPWLADMREQRARAKRARERRYG